jgi:hypothetical protein
MASELQYVRAKRCCLGIYLPKQITRSAVLIVNVCPLSSDLNYDYTIKTLQGVPQLFGLSNFGDDSKARKERRESFSSDQTGGDLL